MKKHWTEHLAWLLFGAGMSALVVMAGMALVIQALE